MMTMDELKAKAASKLELDFVWFDNEKRLLSVGIDWNGPYVVIVDLEHPDGSSIEFAGMIDLEKIFLDSEEQE
jgi:hypothetical protein